MAVQLWAMAAFAPFQLHADAQNDPSTPTVVKSEIEGLETDRSQDQSAKPKNPSLTNPQDIRELVEIKSEFLRMATLRRMLSDKDVQEVLDLFEQAEEISQPNLRLRLQAGIVQKLATLDPQKALEISLDEPTLNRNRLIEAVFKEWFGSSLEDAVKSASTLNYGERLIALKTVYQYRDDLPLDELKQIAVQLGHVRKVRNLQEELAKRAAYTDPRYWWNTILNDPWPDRSQLFVLLAIAEARVQAEGHEVLSEIANAIEHHATRTDLVKRLIDQLAETDPERAFGYDTDLYQQTDGSIFRSSVSEWAKTDPGAALEAVSKLDSQLHRLRLQNSIANSWARTDPHTLLSHNLEKLSQTAQSSARRTAIAEIAKTSPQEAKKFLANLPQSEVETVAIRIAQRWSNTNIAETIDWIKADSNVEKHQRRLFAVVLDELLKGDLDIAMQFALDHTIDSSQDSLEFRFFRYLLGKNELENALEFLPRMREGEGKFGASLDLALNLLINQDIDRALELGELVAIEHKSFYFTTLFESWALYDAQGMYRSLKHLKEEKLKRTAAKALHNNDSSLNERQIKHLKSLM